MQQFLFILTFTLLFGCNAQTINTQKEKKEQSFLPADTNYKWTKLTDSAAYPKAWNFQLFAIRDTLWAMHHAGTWFSLNGREWTKSVLTNVLKNNGFLDYVWFRNAMYALGTFDGNVEHYTWTSSIHKSSDMKNWEVVANESNLPKRFFIHPFVFNEKIWIIGGKDDNQSYAEIWNSEDAVHWKKIGDNMNFGKRAEDEVVFFKGKLFMLGNDVWSSQNATDWNLETTNITDVPIYRYAAVVFDNKIWLLGCNRDGGFSNEVLVSEDGKSWLGEKAPWSPRGAATACVYKGKVFMTGGKYGGTPERTEFIYSNEVWTLERK